jgi:hypothetical protein
MSLSVPVMADAELLVASYLRSQSDVYALVSGRIFTTLPAQPVYPVGIIHRAGGLPVLRMRLDTARIQADAWGRTKAEAHNLAATMRAALHSMTGVHSAGVVTGIDDAVGLTYLQDPDTQIPRYTFAVNVYIHP